MYQIIATEPHGKQRLVATLGSALGARVQFPKHARRFQSVAIIDTSGAAIDHAELSRCAEEEGNAQRS
jgi:hypothetical protein